MDDFKHQFQNGYLFIIFLFTMKANKTSAFPCETIAINEA